MSDLFGNHIVGFPTRWLICCKDGQGDHLACMMSRFTDRTRLYSKHVRKILYTWRSILCNIGNCDS